METSSQIPSSLASLQVSIATAEAVAVYFSTESCSVCHALLPKIEALFSESFPRVQFLHVAMHKLPDAGAAYSVFNAPTLLVFFEGKETFRKSSNMGIGEVYEMLQRPYELLFS